MNWIRTMTSYVLYWLVTFAVFSRTAFIIFKKKKDERISNTQHLNSEEIFNVEEIRDVVFSNGWQPLKISKYSRSLITTGMDRLLYYISQPRYNLDICIYVLTNEDIITILSKLIYRGVKIRLIVDADMAYNNWSSIEKLAKYGIPVRWPKSKKLSHYKFCLADTLSYDYRITPFLMIGSLNWTKEAFTGNYEDYIVTSQQDLVLKYEEEFERLWILLEPMIEL